MPGVRDKLLLNEGRVNGRNADIHEAHRVIGTYADEMKSHNLLGKPEALAFRDRMEKVCAAYEPAQRDYRDECWELADDMRRFIDSQMFPPTP